MARIKIESIIESLDSEMKKALEDAVESVYPNSNIGRYELFREFKRAVGRKCSTWVRVPDRYVERD